MMLALTGPGQLPLGEAVPALTGLSTRGKEIILIEHKVQNETTPRYVNVEFAETSVTAFTSTLATRMKRTSIG